jgi:hypothetical protein
MRSVDIPEPGTPEHTDLLWSLLPHPEGSVVWYFARKDGKNIGDFAENAKELHIAAQAYSKDGYSVYVQMNPTRRRGGTRSSTKDITHWSWLLLDIDPVEEMPNPAVALDAYLERINLTLGTYLHPTIVHSGRGVQAWVRLEDLVFDDFDDGVPDNDIFYGGVPLTPISLRRRTARLALAHLLRKVAKDVGEVAGCRLDTSCADLPRVMRMPGTINQKTGKMAFIAKVGDENKYVSQDMIKLTPPEAFVVREFDPVEGGRKWQDVVSALTLRAANFVRFGTEEPGRHATIYATLMSLRDHGVLEDEARKAVIWGNKATSPPLDLGEVERIIKQVYA